MLFAYSHIKFWLVGFSQQRLGYLIKIYKIFRSYKILFMVLPCLALLEYVEQIVRPTHSCCV